MGLTRVETLERELPIGMQKNRPTVLHVIPGLHTGGAEHALAALVTAKRTQPFSQIVVDLMGTTLGDGAPTQIVRAAGVPVYQFGGQTAFDLPIILFRLARLIRKLRPIAIQSWLYYADLASLWALDLSGQRATTRLYWGIRSSDMDQSHYRRALAWTIRACAKRSARPDAVVANSFAGRDVHRGLGYRPRAFPVIPNGIDTQRFRPDAPARARMRAQLGLADDKPLVIHVARVDPMKDHASLVSVAAALPDIHFVAVGTGTDSINAPTNLTALGIRRDMPNVYTAADLLLSTSIFGEGFPNAVVEAMACGIPVVATDVGDSHRLIEDTGAIVSPRDITAMVAAISRILAEPEANRCARASAARKRIEGRYSLDRMVSTFDALHLHAILPKSDEGDAGRAANLQY
jgi:glycosyltransferase involved in cell wall biosynthesis